MSAAAPAAGPPRAFRLTPAALRALAARHEVRPSKALGQHFLIEPALAERIVALSGVVPGSRVLEVGAGLGSLTVALAAAGADVLAVELDRRLVPALEEAVALAADAGAPGRVRVIRADALTADWSRLLRGRPWWMVANLPYNVAVPVVMRVLEDEPRIERMLVMVQREVGERLAAAPGSRHFGGVSLRVAYRAEARVVRRVARSVFWPQPNVDSVLVSLVRRPPPVEADPEALFRVIEVAFAERRKTMRNALVRLGLRPEDALEVLARCGVDPAARPEQLSLEAFARLSRAAASGRMEP